MSDRLVTLVGALLSLLVFAMLMYTPTPSNPPSIPNTEQDGPNGYLGLKRWLDESRIPTVSLRRRLTALDEVAPGRGHILLTTMPYRKPLRAEEIAAVRDFVYRGNTLVVMAALDDSPEWIFSTFGAAMMGDLVSLTGLSFSAVPGDAGEDLQVGEVLDSVDLSLSPVAEHPLMAEVESLAAVTDGISNIWLPDLSIYDGLVMRLAVEDAHGYNAAWQMPWSDGFVVISASGSLLTNRMLGKADNARFFSNLVELHLDGGTVVFDDYHQGLSELYDPTAFFADSRLHGTLGFIFLFWLLYLVGTSARLKRPDDSQPAPLQEDLVRVMGGFMTRKLGRAEAGRLMVDNWLGELRQRGALGPGDPWAQLAAMPLVSKTGLAALREDYTRLGQGKRVSLKTLHNRILELKRTLQ